MTTRYAKLVNNILEFAPKNKGSILNYNLDIAQLIADGYKEFVPLNPYPTTNRRYHISYNETSDTITEVVVYDETQEEADEREYDQREQQFHQNFFNTSLGYVRRSVSMADGSHKDFLSDLLPAIKTAVELQQPVNVITYEEPPFDEDVTDWTQYQNVVTPTAQFLQECLLQLGNDFLPQN